jgi:RNA polymerase sigma-70 factor (ECF subfamily)
MTIDPALGARLTALLAGYGSKLRALIEQHGLGQYGIDPADVEQEVRIRLWRALQRDRNAVLHTSYIQRTVLSSVIDAIRAAQARPAEPLPDEDEEPIRALAEPAAGPEPRAAIAQQVGRLAACLAELPQRRREVIALHLQGFSLREIGCMHGASEEAVRKLLDRGLKTLRARLQAMGLGEFDD